MTIDDLRNRGLIILECISGSKAYGLDTPTSDTDIKGVFILPKAEYYGLNYIPQVNNETNDVVFYELGRFMELLSLNNPNILELLNTPDNAIIYKHPYLTEIKSELILSKLCNNTFGKFALSQIKKAKGLKKKIVNPVAKERKSVLAFCFVNYEQGAIPLEKYLEIKGWNQENCGLVNIPYMKDVYGLYYSERLGFSGIMKGKDSNDVCLSSIPKGTMQESLLYFNRDGYSTYCKEYREYWDWVDKRNDKRYENTKSHGKNYDAKNMMHVFRLLEMAIEIGKEKKVNVKRPNRDFLLEIKSGKFEYEELLKMADLKQEEMELAFEKSELPTEPDLAMINNLTYRLRDRFYKDKK
ncbi:DNA polymerase beta superfamily protein [Natronoflexus pectinivorans]|uniref:Putative nucleotidyltransferase n=1 Tax=Natronoflexus pectinivorans TaxID=682526 RepID=A0A4R2G3L3_9BACT|nr:nucleotidyltransferase domain-containing protein [Natronoflexus pectinivorans]TCO02188.1 putative nucleotidyltransferase [Natronoflexus pectinivorans]